MAKERTPIKYHRNPALQGKLRKPNYTYITSLKKQYPDYYIRIRYLSGLEVCPDEYKHLLYWDTFKATRNLFYTDLSIKHIEMVQIKPYTSTEKIILKHDR